MVHITVAAHAVVFLQAVVQGTTAEIYLHGAHVTSFKPANAEVRGACQHCAARETTVCCKHALSHAIACRYQARCHETLALESSAVRLHRRCWCAAQGGDDARLHA